MCSTVVDTIGRGEILVPDIYTLGTVMPEMHDSIITHCMVSLVTRLLGQRYQPAQDIENRVV